MQKISIVVIIISLFISPISIGQVNLDRGFIAGEVLVQLESKSRLSELLIKYNLKNKHVVSQRFNIYLLEFDVTRNTNSSIIQLLKDDESVINIQNNHKLTLRDNDQTIPNDTLFHKQWSLLNTGQNSGNNGSDIDATLAWDITRGGITALGDTIVVAIIDGGADLNHEDLNYWKNHNEIPNNNIDDDNNGYIDDYDGWNAYEHNGVIPLSYHGVHVCGIAGAIGNNEIGIAGVNMNVKTLPIAGESSIEAIVVEALSYVYVMRERYDQTNGNEGAFIVSQNNSFGVDKGDPEDFPIWEAMYDSLGQLGILSMGATANKPWDIDSVGDVPTAFTTDYMISVTNTTNKDELYSSAGWGETTIDLGAPGTLIYSLAPNNAYRYSSGTSMATPHVTGAAALLMSAADSVFMVEYKNNPSEGALSIKNWLLAGVDPLTDLEGKTLTGGRLNVYNSLLLMNDYPIINLNKDSIYLEMSLFQNHEEELLIRNLGGDTLFYSLSISDQPGWIELSFNEGVLLSGETDTLKLIFDTYNIDTGMHNVVVHIEGEGAESKDVSVDLYVYDNTYIGDIQQISSVKVFPNPTSSKVEFSFMANSAGETKIEVFDQLGSLIFVDKRSSISGESVVVWSNASIGAGVYFYRIVFNNETITSGKIVKL